MDLDNAIREILNKIEADEDMSKDFISFNEAIEALTNEGFSKEEALQQVSSTWDFPFAKKFFKGDNE